MVAVVEDVTEVVKMVNVAVVEPAGTVTVAGSVALLDFEERLIANPPLGAGPLNVTVPVALCPAPTVVGETAMPVRTAGVTVRVAV